MASAGIRQTESKPHIIEISCDGGNLIGVEINIHTVAKRACKLIHKTARFPEETVLRLSCSTRNNYGINLAVIEQFTEDFADQNGESSRGAEAGPCRERAGDFRVESADGQSPLFKRSKHAARQGFAGSEFCRDRNELVQFYFKAFIASRMDSDKICVVCFIDCC